MRCWIMGAGWLQTDQIPFVPQTVLYHGCVLAAERWRPAEPEACHGPPKDGAGLAEAEFPQMDIISASSQRT